MILKHILCAKGGAVVSIAPGETLKAAARLMASRGIGALVVRDETGTILGIFSERDMLLALADEGEAVFTRSVADLMSADILALTQEAEVNDVMALMTERRKRHFPVVEDGVLVGIVSIGDIVKHKIAEAEQEARALKAYIAG